MLYSFIMQSSSNLLYINHSTNIDVTRKKLEKITGYKIKLIKTLNNTYIKNCLCEKLSQYKKGNWYECELSTLLIELTKVENDYKKNLSAKIDTLKEIRTINNHNVNVLEKVPLEFLTVRNLELIKEHMLKKLILQCGGKSQLSRIAGLQQSTIGGWVQRKQISKKGALLIEQNPLLNTQFKAIELRPDLNTSEII